MSVIISNQKLKDLGFKKIQPTEHESEFSFDWVRLSKGNSTLEVTTEYDLEGKPTKQYTDFNGETLKGRLMRPFELMQLIEMM